MDESALRMLLTNLEGSQSSLHGWLEFWTVLVVIGVVLEVVFVIWEYFEDLQDFRHGTTHPRGRPNLLLLILGLLGATLVAVGVSGELYEETQIEHVETQIRTANDKLYLLLSKEAGDAAQSAKIAHDEAGAVKGIADASKKDAEDALAKSQSAQSELAQAEADAARAQKAASNALRTASEAGQVAHDASKEVAEAAEELRRVKAQRSILHPDKVEAALQQFSGTEYMFSGVGADQDSVALVQQIDDILHKAGWKRQPAHGRYPAINVFDPRIATEDESVTVALTSGVLVSVDSEDTFTVLQSKPLAVLPQYIRAAISLNLSIAANLYPPEEKGKSVVVAKGDSAVIRITIGQKP